MQRLLATTLLLAGCASLTPVQGPSREVIGLTLDDWHRAAAQADGQRYFRHFAPDAIFLGTDPGERWTVEDLRAYAQPYFSAGKGWTYVPRERHVTLARSGKLAWFDECLESEKYGELRGTGVLRRDGEGWKIVQYNLTFPIPNDLTADVVQQIREAAGSGS